jgi:plastocyanin domain-containing protein
MKRIAWMMVWLAVVAGCGSRGAGDGRVAISVTEAGFEPATITVAAGKPVTLLVTRRTYKTCATDLVMPAYHIDRPLPLGRTVEITFTPEKPGELRYACAMGMITGKVIVK